MGVLEQILLLLFECKRYVLHSHGVGHFLGLQLDAPAEVHLDASHKLLLVGGSDADLSSARNQPRSRSAARGGPRGRTVADLVVHDSRLGVPPHVDLMLLVDPETVPRADREAREVLLSLDLPAPMKG